MLASFLLMAAASQVPIEVGRFDPSDFPNAKAVEPRVPQSPLDDPDRVVCEAAKAATGSRLAKKRDCRTVAQWRVYNVDRERQRRDLLGDGTNTKTE